MTGKGAEVKEVEGKGKDCSHMTRAWGLLNTTLPYHSCGYVVLQGQRHVVRWRTIIGALKACDTTVPEMGFPHTSPQRSVILPAQKVLRLRPDLGLDICDHMGPQ